LSHEADFPRLIACRSQEIMNKDADRPTTQDLTPIFAASDSRTDQWRELHALSRAWATVPANGAQAESLRGDAARTFQSLIRLEHSWAFPGPRLLKILAEAMDRREAASFARIVQKISGALLSGDYRRDDFAWTPQRKEKTVRWMRHCHRT